MYPELNDAQIAHVAATLLEAAQAV
jgi:hypothetical protein